MLPVVPPGFEGDPRRFPYLAYDGGDSASIAMVRPGYFHIFRPGTLGTILPTASAILVRAGLADLFATVVESGWRRQEAIVRDPASGTEIRDRYVEIVVADEIEPQSLPDDVSGMKLWRFDQNHLFVSPALMDLTKSQFSDVSFSMGFWAFG